MRILYRAALVALLTWLPLMPPAVRAQVPSEEELKELEQQLLQLEAKKRKEAETGRRRLQEEARKQAELEKQRAAEEEMRRQAEEQRLKEEEAARQRAAQSVQRIAVYIAPKVGAATVNYYGGTLEPGPCLANNLEQKLSTVFRVVKRVNRDRLNDEEQSMVGFLLVAEEPEFRYERKDLLTSTFQLTNPFSLYSAGGNLIDRFSETNSTEVSFASLSVAENFQTAKEAVCTLTKNNISSLLDEIIPRTRNP